MVNSDLRARIAQAIKTSGKKQKEIAAEVGVTPQAITKWLKSGTISTESLEKFASATGVNLVWLITGKENQEVDVIATNSEGAWAIEAKAVKDNYLQGSFALNKSISVDAIWGDLLVQIKDQPIEKMIGMVKDLNSLIEEELDNRSKKSSRPSIGERIQRGLSNAEMQRVIDEDLDKRGPSDPTTIEDLKRVLDVKDKEHSAKKDSKPSS